MQLPRFEYTVKPPHTAGLIDIGSIVQGAQGFARGMGQLGEAIHEWGQKELKAEAEVQIAAYKLSIDEHINAHATEAQKSPLGRDDKGGLVSDGWSKAFVERAKDYDFTGVNKLALPALKNYFNEQVQSAGFKLKEAGRTQFISDLKVTSETTALGFARKGQLDQADATVLGLSPFYSPVEVQNLRESVFNQVFAEGVSAASTPQAVQVLMNTAQAEANARGILFNTAKAAEMGNARVTFLRVQEERTLKDAERSDIEKIYANFDTLTVAGLKAYEGRIPAQTMTGLVKQIQTRDQGGETARLQARILAAGDDIAALNAILPDAQQALSTGTISDVQHNTIWAHINSAAKAARQADKQERREQKQEQKQDDSVRWSEIRQTTTNAVLLKEIGFAIAQKKNPDHWLAEARVGHFDKWHPAPVLGKFDKAYDLDKDKKHTADELQRALDTLNKAGKTDFGFKGTTLNTTEAKEIKDLLHLYTQHEAKLAEREAQRQQYAAEWARLQKGKK